VSNWQEAMQASPNKVIEHKDGPIISGPFDMFPDYVVDLNDVFVATVQDEQGVRRVLEEFEIPTEGWRVATV